MKIIDVRGRWQMANRFWFTRAVNTVTKISVHHDAIAHVANRTEDAVLRQIYNTHTGLGWPGLAYHFVLFPESGNVYWVNDFNLVTWHDAVNWDSIGVMVHGFYHAPHNNAVNDKVQRLLRAVLDELCTNRPQFPADQDDVFAHRERSATACPGDLLAPFVTEYRNKKGAVSWGAVSNTPTTPPMDPNVSRKSSFFDRIVIALHKEYGYFPDDNSNTKTFEQVFGVIKENISERARLGVKAHKWDIVANHYGINSDAQTGPDLIAAANAPIKTLNERITALEKENEKLRLTNENTLVAIKHPFIQFLLPFFYPQK